MKRRRWLGWGCAHCAAFGGLAMAQPGTPASAPAPWTAPQRFVRPDLASDEGGLWALMDREETRVRRSPFRLRDDALNRYLTEIACKLGGAHCPDIRVYPIRMPFFNASMAPNGMMQIWSGLLLRMENEAQLAAVVAHEIGHFMQRHTVERLRDIKAKSAFAQFAALFGVVGLVGQLAALAGALAFSRDQEREADRIGVHLMRDARYDAREASRVWANLLDELKADPANDPAKDSVLFATHPASDERRATLEELAGTADGDRFEDAFRRRIAPLRFDLLEDELKRARPAESLVLLDRLLAREPGSAELLHFRGETRRQRNADGDAALALADLEAAARSGQAPAVTHRSRGQLYRSMNRPAEAREAWIAYLERAPEAPDVALFKQYVEELKP